jgi:quinol monooxygenase YgiN
VEPDTVQRRRLILSILAGLLFAAPLAAQTADGVYVATYFDVQPASVRQGAALVAEYARASRMDSGSTSVEAFQEIGRTHRFVVIEAWATSAAFTAHEQAPHTTDFRNRLKAIHRSPYDQRVNHGFAVDASRAAAGGDAVAVVTHVDVPGPRREEAEALLKRLAEPSRADAGHVRYDVYQQNDPRTNHFTVFAIWSSRAALDAYGATSHWLQFREALGPMLGALYDERLYTALRP